MIIKIKIYLLSFFLRLFLNLIFYTCSIKVYKEKAFITHIKKKSALLAFWHHHSLLFAHYVRRTKLPVWAISSTHPDSEILAKILISWKIKLIRGSSTRGWVNIIKKMIGLYQSSRAVIAVTPDGPRGPRKIAKPGAFNVARKQQAQVFLVAASASSFWSVPSWDKTIIPKPFSTIYVRFTALSPESNIDSVSLSKTLTDNQKKLIRDACSA